MFGVFSYNMQRSIQWRMDLFLMAVVLFIIGFVSNAVAQDAIANATSDGTKVTWAYGAVVAQWTQALSYVAYSAAALLMAWVSKMLPGQFSAIFTTLRVEQLLNKGIDYGINAISGAAKGQVLTVDVGNAVLAQAAAYVLGNAPTWMQNWMGGPEEIVKKIFARLNLHPDASLPPVAEVAAMATFRAQVSK